MRKYNGFTFIEILVTIAILGILTAITAVSFRGANKNARDTERKAELQEIRGGIEEYRLAEGVYPNITDSSVDGVFLADLQPDYVSHSYSDPKNDATHTYEYRYVGVSGCSYVLYSLMENEDNAVACPAACGTNQTGIYCLSE